MKILSFPAILKNKNLTQFIISGLIIFILGVGGYLISTNWQLLPTFLKNLPAGITVFKNNNNSDSEELKIALNDFGKFAEGGTKYVEKAEKGEGTIHLARKTLKNYLDGNQQGFEVTKEHKIYIEDYLAKKTGKAFLNLGEEVEFSEDLIKEAIQKAGTLSPEQLKNLEQYSQLVPAINY